MEWMTGFEAPNTIVEERKYLQPRYIVNVLAESYINEMGETMWKWLSIPLPIGPIKYGDVVAGIVRSKYTQDEMEAITNNMAAINAVFMQTLVTDGVIAATKYLKDSIDNDKSKQFKEMQEWRNMAKELAKSIVKD